MADISIAVDFGGSQSKIIYQLADWDKPKYLLLNPACVEITESQFDSYQKRTDWDGEIAPELKLWCCYSKRVVLLGEYANAYDSQSNLQKLKYEDARWKILGAIGLIVERHSVKLSPRKPLKIDLAAVLPSDEYTDREAFFEQLDLMCSCFQVRDNSIKVSIENFLCRQEGGGLASMYVNWRGSDWLKSKHFGVLMFGHRNVSILVFNRGQRKLTESPHLGFSQLLSLVTAAASGLDKERLTLAIYHSLSKYNQAKLAKHKADHRYNHKEGTNPELFYYIDYPNWKEYKVIQNLVRVSDPLLKEKKTEEISTAIRVATHEYWHKLRNWLSQKLPPDIDEVFIGGGASRFLQPLLEEYFNYVLRRCEIREFSDGKWVTEYKYIYRKHSPDNKNQTHIEWSSRVFSSIKKDFGITNQDDEEYLITERLADCVGVFKSLMRSSGE